MLLLLHPWTTPYMVMLKTLFRYIVLVELFQNAWSLSVLTVTSGKTATSLLRQARWDLVSGPWRKTASHNDEHRLEDVFLDEEIVSVEGEHHPFDEGSNFSFEKFLDDGEMISRELEIDDEYDNTRP
jgi:hypothetical protein